MSVSNNGLPTDVYGTVSQIINTAHVGSPKAIVLTPTTGSPFLKTAIESVLHQEYRDIFHLVIVDGQQYEQEVLKITSQFPAAECKVVVLPFNTGANGMNGHRVYAAFPLLVNSEFIFFLDEDNWWDTDHASSLINLMEENDADWVYSMRKIFTYDGRYIADDNCESIGPYLPYSNKVKDWPSYIDTNCYAFKRDTIVQTAHHWYHPLRADRFYFSRVSERFPRFLSSKSYTANYRLKKNGPISANYIIEGNNYMIEKYPSGLPWL